MKTVIFTGGGSGGHVMPAITLIKELKQYENLSLFYIGSRKGIERSLLPVLVDRYHPIYTGKLRRYLSLENFFDLFRVLIGFFQSVFILLKYKSRDTLIFSTGGFVSLPVVYAAKLTGKKVFVHEQTSVSGLANKLASFIADKIFISFESSKKYFPAEKTFYSGYPLRDECFTREVTEVIIDGIVLKDILKPILFITGGGNGSKLLNKLLLDNMELLSKEYFIVHQVGKLFINIFQKYTNDSYKPVAFIDNEMIDLFKLSSVIISRSGAGTIAELLALRKKTILIPLKNSAKNEQYLNAKEAEKYLGSIIVEEDNLGSVNIVELCSVILQSELLYSTSSETVRAKDVLIDEIAGYVLNE